MKYLIAGGVYSNSDYKAFLAEQWCRVGRKLNPFTDMLLVDATYNDFVTFEYEKYNVKLIRLEGNLGHLQETGKDGWGRATMAALQYSIDEGYEYVFTYDADVLLTFPADNTFQYMIDNNINVISTRCSRYGWLEGIFFFNVKWLKEFQFIEKYNWPAMKAGVYPERHIEGIIKDYLKLMDFKGIRDDGNLLTPENVWNHFPNGLDYVTHCRDLNVYKEVTKHYELD